ncbi:MAG: hypothetical protein ACK55X_03565 [Synechococcaceae cyanobacterium]
MINFEDELAWLNHRLDEPLKIWRKKHQLHGRIIYLLVNSSLVFLCLYIGSGLRNNINGAVWLSIFIATLSILIFSVLARQLYARLLTDGHSLKAEIYKARASGKKEADYQKLCKFQDNLKKLFAIELDFPIKQSASCIDSSAIHPAMQNGNEDS